MKLHIENSIVIENNGRKVTFDKGEYEFDSASEFIKFIEGLGEQPKEPLIKDEKIRKAVRAWAWANNIDEIDHWQGQLTGRKAGCSRGRAKIQFNRALGFNYGCGFTLAELCGEEDE